MYQVFFLNMPVEKSLELIKNMEVSIEENKERNKSVMVDKIVFDIEFKNIPP